MHLLGYPAEEFRSMYVEHGFGGLHYGEHEFPPLHFSYNGTRLDELSVANLPEMAEVFGNRPGIPAHKDAQENQTDERERLDAGENILDQLAQPDSERIQEGEENDHDDGNELLDGKADGKF